MSVAAVFAMVVLLGFLLRQRLSPARLSQMIGGSGCGLAIVWTAQTFVAASHG